MVHPYQAIFDRFDKLEASLAALTAAQKQTPNKKLLTLEEAMERWPLWSKSNWYKKTSTNEIPHLKPQGKLMFDVEEMENWFRSHSIKTGEQIAVETLSK